jgi:glycosyltransferase involved in cell wall biosynthesis
MQKIDAIYIARDDARDIRAWSGTPFFMARALESAGFGLNFIGPLNLRFPLFYKVKGNLIRMCGWDYNSDSEPAILKSYARQAEALMQPMSGRVILSCGKPHLAHLRTNLPIVFFDEASVPALTKLHPGHENYYPPCMRKLLAAERAVLGKCRYACYMSDWAAEAALECYGDEFKSKIKVVPIGANMDRLPTREEIEKCILDKKHDTCRLLFVGVNWQHKGGAIAVAVGEELRRRGVPVRLDVVGGIPPVPVPDFVRVHGFVSKKTDEGRSFMASLYRESHFFLLPTQAEAYGISFVEACAHGLPCLGCGVGGVTTIIQDGVNGWLFAPDAPAGLYADRIQSAWQNPRTYQDLCRSAFQSTQTRLSWKQFGNTVYELVSKL